MIDTHTHTKKRAEKENERDTPRETNGVRETFINVTVTKRLRS